MSAFAVVKPPAPGAAADDSILALSDIAERIVEAQEYRGLPTRALGGARRGAPASRARTRPPPPPARSGSSDPRARRSARSTGIPKVCSIRPAAAPSRRSTTNPSRSPAHSPATASALCVSPSISIRRARTLYRPVSGGVRGSTACTTGLTADDARSTQDSLEHARDRHDRHQADDRVGRPEHDEVRIDPGKRLRRRRRRPRLDLHGERRRRSAPAHQVVLQRMPALLGLDPRPVRSRGRGDDRHLHPDRRRNNDVPPRPDRARPRATRCEASSVRCRDRPSETSPPRRAHRRMRSCRPDAPSRAPRRTPRPRRTERCRSRARPRAR